MQVAQVSGFLDTEGEAETQAVQWGPKATWQVNESPEKPESVPCPAQLISLWGPGEPLCSPWGNERTEHTFQELFFLMVSL